MKLEKEITVLVNSSYQELHLDLITKGFKIIEEYQLDDIYLVPNDINLKEEKPINILRKCILVRNIDNKKKKLTYKYKKFADNGDILEQGKVDCPITDINSGVNFMNSIGYKELLKIYDKIIVYSNDLFELAVQLVNNKYIFIEVEDENKYTGKYYNNINDMINDLKALNLNCDYTNFYVKKAELVFNDVYNQ